MRTLHLVPMTEIRVPSRIVSYIARLVEIKIDSMTLSRIRSKHAGMTRWMILSTSGSKVCTVFMEAERKESISDIFKAIQTKSFIKTYSIFLRRAFK